MAWGTDVVGVTARGAALALGVLAVAALRQPQPAPVLPPTVAAVASSHPSGGLDPTLGPAQAAPGTADDTLDAADPGGRWALRTGGWFIRVDGAEVSLPSLSVQTAARPRAGLAVTISPYDQLIWYHANAEGFDWRLVAALIFEESGFNPTARSDKGAYGLMQVRPIAAEAVGAARFDTPDDNIRTGVRYLRQLDEMFQSVRGFDRLPFVLAAYNVGPGHVRDAQILARRFGYDPYRWDDAVAVMLPLLEEPAIYETVPLGYARGADTVAYVSRVLDRFRRYRHTTPAATDAGVSAAADSARTG